MKAFLFLLFAGLVGCGSSDDEAKEAPPEGGEGQACYGNNTCDPGLRCLSKHCVVDDTSGGTAGTGGVPTAGTGATGGTTGPVGGSASGSAQGGGAGAPPDEPECVTQEVANAMASEKVNAAFCFGLGFAEEFACNFNAAANETRCLGTTTAYVVVYMETANGTVGDVYDLSDGAHMATVIQGQTGSFDIQLDSGQTASCIVNGDVATLCVNPL